MGMVVDSSRDFEEMPGYLEVGGERLYHVLHGCPKPTLRVLLAGPFASERGNSYIPWVRWARFLASHGLQAVRFDYRGVGESSGEFEEMSFADWAEDIQAVAEQVRAKSPGGPLVLHGLGMGGLLAADVFRKGIGDALLLWSAPECGTDVLRAGLTRQLAASYGEQTQGLRRTYADFIAELEAGKVIEVEGYRWSRRLWQDAAAFRLAGADSRGRQDTTGLGKPWKHVTLNQSHAPLISGMGQWLALTLNPVLRRVALNPDLGAFFHENLKWICEVTGQPAQESK
jgi:pimeloyl-ACP methyl ester carboxylesterase